MEGLGSPFLFIRIHLVFLKNQIIASESQHKKGNLMSKGNKGRGKIHSTSRSWEKSLKKVSKAKSRQKAKGIIRKQGD